MQCRLQVFAAQKAAHLVLNVFGLAFFHHQHSTFAQGKASQLVGQQRVGHVQHQKWNVAVAKRVTQAELLQGAHQRVVQAALHHNADVLPEPFHQFVELLLQNVLARRGQTLFVFELFVPEGDRRVRQLVVVERGRLGHQLLRGYGGWAVVLAFKTAAHMACAYAQFQHHRHVRCL